MSESKVKLSFEIVRDGAVVRREELGQDVIKIGKLASSHLKLEDDSVSRIHAVIERAPDGTFSIIDLGSASGTYVNDEKVTKAALGRGDEVRCGDTVIRVDVVAVEEKAPMAFGGTADETRVTGGIEVAVAGDVHAAATVEASTPESLVQEEVVEAAPKKVVLEDGAEVEPYTLQGYYDEAGNYFPAYYDETGQLHLGYGYYDEEGAWQVSAGYYNADGEWLDTPEPVGSVPNQRGEGGPSAGAIYRDQFFDSSGGDTLEVAMLFSGQVLTVASFESPRTVLVGDTKKSDFVFEHPGFSGAEYPLVEFQGGGYALVITEEMRGEVMHGDERFTLDEAVQQGVARSSASVAGAYEVALGRETVARVDLGRTTFLVHFTDMPTVIGGGAAFDTTPLPYVGMSAAAHILFLLLAMSIPADAGDLDFDGLQPDDRFAQMLIKPEQEEEEEPNWLDDGGDEDEAAKHKGEDGEAGKEDAEQEDKRMAIEGPPDNTDLQLKKAEDMRIAQSAGIMNVFQADQVSSMWGDSTTSVGSDAIHALGNLQGDSVGVARGMGGLGMSGAGRGGGGMSERGIGMANVGTAGRGGGGRGGKGYGKAASDLGDRDSKIPQVVPGKPLVTGSLDKEIIRRVIRKNRREIKFCYEQELQKDKSLAGEVVMNFTIAPTGNVVAAKTRKTTLKNAAVERCMASKIRRWVFPEPKGGGMVIVNYPFNFSSN